MGRRGSVSGQGHSWRCSQGGGYRRNMKGKCQLAPPAPIFWSPPCWALPGLASSAVSWDEAQGRPWLLLSLPPGPKPVEAECWVSHHLSNGPFAPLCTRQVSLKLAWWGRSSGEKMARTGDRPLLGSTAPPSGTVGKLLPLLSLSFLICELGLMMQSMITPVVKGFFKKKFN